MYIYAGKFSHVDGYAKDDLWTLTFPDEIKAGNDAIVICQWTSTGDGQSRQNTEWRGKITRFDTMENGSKIQLFKDDSTLYYWFDGTISSGDERVVFDMKNPRNEYCGPVATKIVFSKT